MHPLTLAIREQYEQFPYPSGPPTLRTASDVRLLLSYGALSPPARPLRALDAGCGRGARLIANALLQPDVQFTGIDVNRVALADVEAEAARRGLTNVQVQEVDLMTLDGLDVPDGGYDVIYSSGVVHHLADPLAGLTLLGKVLAPHGVLALMVYGRYGRQPLYRLARAIELLAPSDEPLQDRLAVGRQLAQAVTTDTLTAGPWHSGASVDNVEFVDRYLNANETSYDISGLWTLLTGAGLRFLRWVEPQDWSVEALLPPGPLQARASRLPRLQQFQLVEQIAWRPALDAVVARAGNPPRPVITRHQLRDTLLAVSPQVAFGSETRNVPTGQRIDRLYYRLRTREPEDIPNSPLAAAAQILATQLEPFPGAALVDALIQEGVDQDVALIVLEELLRREILYAPHPTPG